MTRRASWFRGALAAAALATTSCAAPLMKLPSGSATLATDGAEVRRQASATCRSIRTISAEVSVQGKVGGHRLRARLLAGLASPASAYIEAPAPFGSPIFIFSARDDDATLLLPRDRRVLERGRPADVLEAIAGVPLGPSDLREALTGCSADPSASTVQALGADWRMASGPTDLYWHRDRPMDPWRLVVVRHHDAGRPDWRAEYRDFMNDIPRTIRLISADRRRFDLSLNLSQVEINVPLDAETFRIQIPPGTSPISLEELRDSGPLAAPEKFDE